MTCNGEPEWGTFLRPGQLDKDIEEEGRSIEVALGGVLRCAE